ARVVVHAGHLAEEAPRAERGHGPVIRQGDRRIDGNERATALLFAVVLVARYEADCEAPDQVERAPVHTGTLGAVLEGLCVLALGVERDFDRPLLDHVGRRAVIALVADHVTLLVTPAHDRL